MVAQKISAPACRGGPASPGVTATRGTNSADPHDAADDMTVLCSFGRILTKRVRVNGSLVPYDRAKHFRVGALAVGSFADLAATLDQLSSIPYCAVIRGDPRPQVDPWRTLRRKENFDPTPRRWLAVDIDGVDEPAGLCFAAEPEDAVEYVRDQLLPVSFEGTSCWWQATSSAGIKPGIRLRLWFWCGRPVSDEEARRWLAEAPVDLSLYRPVTLHYVAAPIIETGARDPMARRQGVLDGSEEVAVPHLPPSTPRPMTAPTTGMSNAYALAALERAVGQVMSAPEGCRNNTLNREAFSVARLIGAGFHRDVWHGALAAAALYAGLEEQEVEETLVSALDAARGGRQ
jgi:hypothetical protein